MSVQYAEEGSVEEKVREGMIYATYNCSNRNRVLLLDGVQLTSSPNGREHNVQVVHDMPEMVQALLEVRLTGMLMKCVKGGKFRCFVRILSYCRHIVGSETMYGLRHGMVVVHPCIGCIGTAQDVQNMIQSQEHRVREVWRVISGVQ